MRTNVWTRRVAAYMAALGLVVLWGSVLQTQYNLAALQQLGAQISLPVRASTTAQDLLGFGPLYALVAAVALLPAFVVAGWLARRARLSRSRLFALAGWLSLIVAIRIVDALVPPPVLIAATRSTAGLLWMTLGGALGGWLYARLSARRSG